MAEIGGSVTTFQVIDTTTPLKVVQPDVTNGAALDLTTVGASVNFPVDNGVGTLGVDVTGLTGSGATVVCEMRVGLTWKPSNMLVNGSGGAFTQAITVDSQFRGSTAAKQEVRVRVSVAGTGTANVAWALSTNSSLIQMTSPLPPGTNAIGTIGVTSLPAITFASPQAVTQSGAWAFSLTGTPTVNANVVFPTSQAVTGTVNVGNLPATQPVSGTVTANVAFPATQAVTGTFWQATQPVSAASLPLPVGAATATKQDAIVTAIGAPLQAGVALPAGTNLIGATTARGTSAFAVAQIAVGTTATQIVPARASRAQVRVILHGAVNVYFGPTNTVTAANGYRVPAVEGASIPFDTTAAVYAIAGSATTVSYVEFY